MLSRHHADCGDRNLRCVMHVLYGALNEFPSPEHEVGSRLLRINSLSIRDHASS